MSYNDCKKYSIYLQGRNQANNRSLKTFFPKQKVASECLTYLFGNGGHNALDLGVGFQPVLSEFTSGSGLFVPAKWLGGVKHIVAIYPEKTSSFQPTQGVI